MRTFEEYRAMVEESLLPVLGSVGEIPPELMEAMSYSLKAGGKRIRPVMLMAACDMAGGDIDTAIPFAAALEMIHTYSLIHDDLPAMDNDDLRRGKPTNHKVFGEGMAVLAGDGLLNTAAEIMARAASEMDDLSGTRAMYAVLHRAGTAGMIAGQAEDISAEGKNIPEDALRYIHERKTADLLTAPIEAGLILAGASDETIQLGRKYGMHLGLAFQMTDDLLDVTGTEEVLGKKTGQDAAMNKTTWITFRGIEGTAQDAADAVDRAVEAAECMKGCDSTFFVNLALSIKGRVK